MDPTAHQEWENINMDPTLSKPMKQQTLAQETSSTQESTSYEENRPLGRKKRGSIKKWKMVARQPRQTGEKTERGNDCKAQKRKQEGEALEILMVKRSKTERINKDQNYADTVAGTQIFSHLPETEEFYKIESEMVAEFVEISTAAVEQPCQQP